MKRSGFLKRKTPLRPRRVDAPVVEREPRPMALVTVKPLRMGTYGGTTAAAPKPAPMLQHAGYMAAVRDLGYCMHCRRSCRPQFCHRDQTKGVGIKTDVREGWPGCEECHRLIGTTRIYPKEERRVLELELGRRTRAAVIAAGTWPARLPLWKE